MNGTSSDSASPAATWFTGTGGSRLEIQMSEFTSPSIVLDRPVKVAASVSGRISPRSRALGRKANQMPTTIGAAHTSEPRNAIGPQLRITLMRGITRQARWRDLLSRRGIWYVLTSMDRDTELALLERVRG